MEKEAAEAKEKEEKAKKDEEERLKKEAELKEKEEVGILITNTLKFNLNFCSGPDCINVV